MANDDHIALSGANLSEAKPAVADFQQADLSGADLSGAYGIGASLGGANLSGANLSGADLRGAKVISSIAQPLHAARRLLAALSPLQSKLSRWHLWP